MGSRSKAVPAAGRLPIGLVGRRLQLLGASERSAGGPEEDQSGDHEDPEEGVQLRDLGEEQGDEPQGAADPEDHEHGVPVRQTEVEESMVDVRAVRGEG